MTTTAAIIQLSELVAIPALSDLPEPQLRSLAETVICRHYTPGQIIFVEGEQSGSLWFVLHGRVKIIKQSLSGRIQGLCLMDRGKCFGSCPLFDMDTNPATAQALDEVTLLILPEHALNHLNEHSPQLVKTLLHIYSQRLEHLARVSEVLGSWTVADRINDCLLTYREHHPEHSSVTLTHEKLAALSGTVREVVSRHLSTLEREGVIRNETGRIIILNSDALLPPCAKSTNKGNPAAM